MVKLLETSPCAGLLPRQIGQTALSERLQGPIWSVAPFAGQKLAVARALQKIGLTFPEPGQVVQSSVPSVVWFGHDQALVFDVAALPKLAAAVTDQSDGWARVRVEGRALEVLARLVPVDLRKQSGALRSMIGHMSAIIIVRNDDVIDVMVMRAMAKTLVHELEVAATGVAARG